MSAVELEGWSTVQSQAGFSTGYWTLCVLTSCTVLSKILEPVNTSSQARAPVNPDVATLTLNISEATTGCIRPFSPISSFPSPPTAFHTHCPHRWDPWAWRLSLRAFSASPPPPPAGLTSSSWQAACAWGPSLCPQFLVPAGTASFSCLQPPSLSVPLRDFEHLKTSSIF